MSFQQQFFGFMAIIRKEVSRTFRIWPQSLLPPVITMSLYYLIFGRVIGARIPSMQGFSYVQFISPGLIMMSVMVNSYSGSSFAFFSAKFSRAIEELLVSPMSCYSILLGYVCSSVCRGLLVGALVVCVSLLFTHLAVHHVFLLIYTLFITSILFSLVGLVNGIMARSFDDVSWVPAFVITPLTYLGGVFFSHAALPGIWQQLALLDPLYYIIQSFRFAMLGVGGAHAALALSFVTMLVAGFFMLVIHLLGHSKSLRS